MPSSFFLGVLLLLGTYTSLRGVDAAARCYRHDTLEMTDSIYTPCSNSTPFSMCLRSQPTADGFPPDIRCLDNGLAQYRPGPNEGNSEISYWREGCTDPTWKSEYCLNEFNVCNNDDSRSGSGTVTPCEGIGGTKWCCGGTTSCCDSDPIVIKAVIGPDPTTSSTSTTTSTIKTSTSTSSSQTSTGTSPKSTQTTSPATESQPPTTRNTSTSSLSTGAKIGIIIASIVAFLSIVLALFICVRYKQKISRLSAQNSFPYDQNQMPDSSRHMNMYMRDTMSAGSNLTRYATRDMSSAGANLTKYEMGGVREWELAGQKMRHEKVGDTPPRFPGPDPVELDTVLYR